MPEMYFLSLTRGTSLADTWYMHSPADSSHPPEKTPKTMPLPVESDNDRTVDIQPGETVLTSLPENSTTGYR